MSDCPSSAQGWYEMDFRHRERMRNNYAAEAFADTSEYCKPLVREGK